MTLKGQLIVAAFLAVLAGLGFYSAFGGGWLTSLIACAVGTVALPLLTFTATGRHPYTIWAVWALVALAWGVTGAGIALYVGSISLAIPCLALAAGAAVAAFRLTNVMVPDYAMFADIVAGKPADTPQVQARLHTLGAYYKKLNAVRAKFGLSPAGATGEYTKTKNPNAYWAEDKAGEAAKPPTGNRAERRAQDAEARKRK